MGRLGWASRLVVATLVATSVISGVGAVPWLERSDSDGDGTEELGVEWNSLAGEAGAAASGAPGLSCPDGMVLDDGLCKTPRTETVPVTHVCPQAADGYVLVSAVDKLGESHSCQKTVPAHCIGGKVLHEGKCQTATVEHEPATWPCDVGTPVTSSGDQGVAHSCKIALDTPTCPTGQAYRTEDGAGCYRDDSYYKKRGYDWECSEGTLETTSGDHGVSRSCKVTLNPPQCPAGETYRNSRCEIEEDYYKKRGFDWGCSEGTYVRTSGDHGVSHSCRVTLNPPQCPAGETYRNSRCEQEQDFYRTRGFAWTCSQGTYVRTSGDHGVSHSCRVTLNPPTCPDGETYLTVPAKGCYRSESFYDSAPLDYSCPATYTLRTSGTTRSCSKVEKYRKRVCAFDPVAGQQCWWENRTRTVTTAVIESCPSGYSPDGTGCTADAASTRWKRTASTPTRYRYDPAVRSCPTGYSDNGTQCESDTASTRWKRTASTPTRYRYDPAVRSCPTGYSDNGTQCESDTASQRWVVTASTPAKHRYDPADKSCPTGYTDNGTQCQADVLTPKWTPTTSTPTTHRYEPADPQCTTAGFEYSSVTSRCEKTVYTDPTEPLTRLVGRTPKPTCPDGYTLAGAGRCARTVLGEPTQAPIGAECLDHLGTLGAGTVTRSGTLEAGCVSLRRGDAQSPHWARRFTLGVPAASTATISASSSSADVYLYVLSSSGGSVAVEGSDDDSGTGTDAQVSGVALAAGTTYTIEVTTSSAGPINSSTGPAGAFTLTVTTALDEPPVIITGLADAAVTGRGTLTAAGTFTVEPADATCTAAAAGVTPSVAKTGTPGERTVSLTLAAPFSHAVTVTCDAPRRTATSVGVTLAGRLPAVSVTDFEDTTARVASRGLRYATDKITVDPADASCSVRTAGRGVNRPWVSDRGPRRIVLAYLLRDGAAIVTVTCTAPDHSPGSASALFSAQPRPQIGTVTATFAPNNACTATTAQDADAAHSCTLAEGSSLAVTLTATVDSAAIATSWDTDSAITVTPGRARAATPVIGPDNAATGDWQRTATATLACTGDGAAAATVTAGRYPADDTHTTRIGIDCEQQVRISGLDDATGYSAPGTEAAVTDAFTVDPATADCTASPTGAVTAPDPRRPHERLLSAQITAGTNTTVTVTCTADGRADGVEEVDLTAEEPGLSAVVGGQTCAAVSPAPAGADAGYRCVLSGAHRLVLAATADARVRGISIGWSASGGAAVSGRRTDAVAAVAAPGGELTGVWRRVGSAVVGCSADGSVTVTAKVGSGAGAVTHVSNVRVVCEDQGAITGLEDAVGAGTGAVTVSTVFTVTPAAARCTAASASGEPKVAEGIAGSRTVSMGLAAVPGRVVGATVSVDCTPPGHAPVTATAAFTVSYVDSCDDPLGTLADGVTTRSGTIAQNPACVSPQRRTNGGSSKHYPARRHTFTLANPAAVRIDVGPPTRRGLDTFVVLLEGHSQDGSGTVLGRDNNSGPRNGARLAGLRLAPGDYTIEATTANKRRTGNYDLRVDAQLDVLIANLDGNSRVGTGTATDYFTVLPADATCTPTAGTVTDLGSGRRILSAGITALGDTDITVTCRRAGYGTATAASTLTALTPVSDVTVDAASGGTCKPYRGTLDAGVDQAFACTLTAGTPLTVDAEATGPSSQMKLVWTAQAGATVMTPDDGDLSVSVVGGEVVFARSGTGTVTCSTDAEVTLDVEVGETAEHTTVLKIDCEPPVQITDYVPDSRDGAGAMTGTFDVVPATAQCKARNAGGIAGRPSEDGTGTSRTVSVTTTATGWLDVEIKCGATDYADTTATARFVARDESNCMSPLGVLRHGTRTFTGSLSATSCLSKQRLAGSQTTFYAHRYTLTLATSGWVSVDLEPTDTGNDALDTYLLLLDGHGSGSAVLHSHNNLHGDATQLDDIYLTAGTYTVEATTALSNSTGGYRLTVKGDFAFRSDDLPATLTATVGQTAKHRFDYLPHDATVTIAAADPQTLAASVAALHGTAVADITPRKAGNTDVTVTFIASGHASTETVTVTSYCQSGYRPSPDGACQPLTPTLDQSCFATLAEGRVWGRRRGATILLESLFEGACDSVSVSGKKAVFQAFEVPAAATARTPYEVTVELEVTREALLFSGTDTISHRPRLPLLSVVLWKVSGADYAGTVVPSSRDASRDRSRARFTATVTPGSYVVEVVPQYAMREDAARDITIGDRFAVSATLPSMRQNLADVHYLGNIRLNDAGATLDSFLNARGTLRYGASEENPTNDDDLFDPESPTYPWLSFSVDRCSIPEGVVAIGDAVVDRILAALLMEWSGIYSGDIEGSRLDEAIRAEWFRDFPDFGGAQVAFVYACMRHDFNWKNLDRVAWFYNHGPDATTSTDTYALESNARMYDDLEILCKANRDSAIERSVKYTWYIAELTDLRDCLRTATFIQAALDRVPVWWRPYNWGTYDSR